MDEETQESPALGIHAIPQLLTTSGLISDDAIRDLIEAVGLEHLIESLRADGRIDHRQAEALQAVSEGMPVCDRYLALHQLGQGATGSVYLARELNSGVDVALKILLRSMTENHQVMERFAREAELLIHIDHPHIARAYAHGTSAGAPWMALELINGPSLDVVVKESGALPEPYVLRIIVQIAQGLEYAYRNCQLIHRDLKPGNIIAARDPSAEGSNRNLYTDHDTAKIIDFGLARTTQTDAALTATGMTMGTPAYMSPEQIRAADLDCRSDIYALGATMYHLLTGEPPFSGPSAMVVMTAHMTEPVPDPRIKVPGLSRYTRDLVMTAMAKNRDQRFTSHGAFLKSCKHALEDIGLNVNDNMRLLRKPMVLKTPRAHQTSRPRPPSSTGFPATRATAEANGPGPEPAQTTDRILRKIRAKRNADGSETSSQENTSGSAATWHVPDDVAGHAAHTSATEALRQATRRHVQNHHKEPATGKTTVLRADDIPDRPLSAPAPTTTQLDDDLHPGTGMLPWAVLVIAAILAIVLIALFAKPL